MKDSVSIANALRERTANGVFKVLESRTQLAKRELAAADAATDVKTARLRALRLDKEREEAAASATLEDKKRKPARPSRGAGS